MGTPYENGLQQGRISKEHLVHQGWVGEVGKENKLLGPQEILYRAASRCLAACEKNFAEEIANLPTLGEYAAHHEQYMRGIIEAERESLNAIIAESMGAIVKGKK